MRAALVSSLWCATLAASSPAGAQECASVPVWRDGQRVAAVCRQEAAELGLTLIDLRDDWLPRAFAPDADGAAPSYRATYLALAQERFAEAGAEGALALADRYLELYGIVPALGGVRARLGDEARHRCHAGVGDDALATASRRIVEETWSAARARRARAAALRESLEADRRHARLPDLVALAASGAHVRRQVERLAAMEAQAAIVRVVQAHLACDGLFAHPPIAGAYTWQTSEALARFQRAAMILPTGDLDVTTLDALRIESRERDYRAALRVLRSRVAAASGLIEDGTAGAGQALVLGRELEPAATWRVRGHEPLAGAAPDLISSATEVAARALGWTDAAATLAFLTAPAVSEVAVALPAPPDYHRGPMTLSVDIDRGDVWYDPWPRWRDAPRRPAIILYALVGERRVPLARWPTTIGGWQREQIAAGRVTRTWKESPVGRRWWREVYVGPTWLAPATTPDRELVRRTDGRFVLAREAFGPSYRAAFGLISFPHLAEQRERGRTVLAYQSVRTHGTGNVASIENGVSHGCHRVLGAHAMRLAEFVLAHQPHVRRGDQPTDYRRVVRHGGRFTVAIDTRGYLIELAAPIPVDVLPGRIHRVRRARRRELSR